MFLPGCATDVDSVAAVRPDLALCMEEAVVARSERLATATGAAARITDLAFAGDLSGAAVFLCGNPDMVETAPVAAVRAGVVLDLIRADPFDRPEPYETTEGWKLVAFRPDPELWAALDRGGKRTAVAAARLEA